MRKGNIALVIVGLGIVAGILVVLLIKPGEPRDRFGELGKRKADQESQAATPSASPVEVATPSATP